MTDTIVATIARNARESIRVSLTTYKGHRLVDIRTFADPGGGVDPQPTRKGLTCKAALLPALAKAVADAEQEARRQGLLDDEEAA